MNKDEGARLKVCRKTLIGSQENMSELLGSTQSSMSDAERGKVRISTDILRTLMTNYRLNPFWLFFGKPPMQISEAHLAYLRSEEEEGDSIYYLLTEALGPLSLESSNMIIPVDLHDAYVEAVLNGKWDVEKLHAVRVTKFPGTTGLLRTFQLQGNNLAPTFNSGDYLCCSPREGIKNARTNSLCVVITRSNGIFAARIEAHTSKRKVQFTFDNSLAGEGHVLPYKEVLEVWEVKSQITAVFNNSLAARVERLENQ